MYLNNQIHTSVSISFRRSSRILSHFQEHVFDIGLSSSWRTRFFWCLINVFFFFSFFSLRTFQFFYKEQYDSINSGKMKWDNIRSIFVHSITNTQARFYLNGICVLRVHLPSHHQISHVHLQHTRSNRKSTFN